MNQASKERQTTESAADTTASAEQRERKPFLSMGAWVIVVITVVEITFLCMFTNFPLKVMNIAPESIKTLLAKVITVPPEFQTQRHLTTVHARPLTRADILSELSRSTPTAEVCEQIARMAHEDGIGTKRQTYDPGTSFLRQVTTCVQKKRWPKAMVSDPAVAWAVSETKALEEAGTLF